MSEKARVATLHDKYSNSRVYSVVLAHPDAWEGATYSRFLRSCKDGTATKAQFDRWLCQDRLFVHSFQRFALRVYEKAPDQHKDLLQQGLDALEDEVQWFQAKAVERGLPAASEKSATLEKYSQKLEETAQAPYCVLAAFFWAIEYVYNEGWLRNSPMQPEYQEYAERWGNTGFSDYVWRLCGQADEACEGCSQEEWRQIEDIITWTATIEIDFWEDAMAHR